jgi:hypothetical protein
MSILATVQLNLKVDSMNVRGFEREVVLHIHPLLALQYLLFLRLLHMAFF